MKRSQNKCGESIIFRDKVKSKSHIKLNNCWGKLGGGTEIHSPWVCPVVRWQHAIEILIVKGEISLTRTIHCTKQNLSWQSHLSLSCLQYGFFSRFIYASQVEGTIKIN